MKVMWILKDCGHDQPRKGLVCLQIKDTATKQTIYSYYYNYIYIAISMGQEGFTYSSNPFHEYELIPGEMLS